MNPVDEKTLTIARRSRKNLEFIYNQKGKGADVEEFTQLLNSMLGMLICLREEYFKGKEVTWNDVQDQELQPIEIEGNPPNPSSPHLEKSKTFSKLISNMRHAFAHNCFKLKGNPIAGVEIWNIPNDEENEPISRTWEAELSEQQLRKLADLFIDYLEKKHGHEMTC